MGVFFRHITTFLFMFFAAVVFASAAPPEVKVTMQPDSILIGDHVKLRIEVTKDMMQLVDFPVFTGEEGKRDDKMVIVRELPVDTLEVSGRRQVLAKEYVVTSFREGIYSMDDIPVLYVDKNITDTMRVGPGMPLRVYTLAVDTLNTTIYDIKTPEGAPVMVDEYRGYVIGAIIIACILVAAVWAVANAIARRRRRSSEEKPRPRIAPHVRAINDLEQLHNQKLWQNNKHKLYYTRLTDIIREYLEGRYGIGAMEMTSDEIMSSITDIGLSEKSYRDIVDLLRTADLVKFAKFVPDKDYNENIYYKAYYFVEETKEIAEEVKEKEVTNIEPESPAGNEQ